MRKVTAPLFGWGSLGGRVESDARCEAWRGAARAVTRDAGCFLVSSCAPLSFQFVCTATVPSLLLVALFPEDALSFGVDEVDDAFARGGVAPILRRTCVVCVLGVYMWAPNPTQSINQSQGSQG